MPKRNSLSEEDAHKAITLLRSGKIEEGYVIIKEQLDFIIKILLGSYHINAYDEADLYNEIVMTIIVELPKITLDYNVGTIEGLMYQISKHRLLNLLGKEGKKKRKTLNKSQSLDATNEKGESYVDKISYKDKPISDDREILVDIISDCNIEGIEKLVLPYLLSDWTYEEIAKKLKITTKSVDNARSRIVKKCSEIVRIRRMKLE